MPEIRLTPVRSLHWHEAVADAISELEDAIGNAFQKDWREGLYLLAARRPQTAAWPSLRFWQLFAEIYLSALCHMPPESKNTQPQSPAAEEWARRILTAPPLPGGEYLSVESLCGLWDALDSWVQAAIAESGGLEHFFEARAPKWRQVGRVYLHLAENRNNPELPFAFMVSYTTGLGGDGRPKHLPLGKALEQYAGASNRAALLRLLTPLQHAAERCRWLRLLIDSRAIYQPTAWTASQAYELLTSVPQLEESGLTVRLPDWWKARSRPRVTINIERADRSQLGVDSMLAFDVSMALGDATLSPEQIDELLRQQDRLVLFKGQWVEVDRDKLREALKHWKRVELQARDGTISFIEGMRLLAGAPADLRDDAHAAEEREWLQVRAGAGLDGLLTQLRDPSQLAALEAGDAFKARLRPYQRQGVSWLHLLTGLGLGACLADDMGLGKTLQVLALLSCRQKGVAAGPCLLVVPASLLANWRAEAQRFAPSLKLVFLHPSEAGKDELELIAASPQVELANADLVVTSYSILHRQPWLQELQWALVILDEAQAIRNAETRQSKLVRQLPAQARIALTGTPIENRLGDLWSLFDFLNPGLLGSAAAFKSFVKRLASGQQPSYAPLRKLVSPYLLRRMKTDRTIIADLPDKIEAVRYCGLTRAQAQLYRQVVDELAEALATTDGIARRGLVLKTLMRLKQICNHPSQLTGDGGYAADASGKFQCLADIGQELAERQERLLVFTQFREVIDPLLQHLAGIFGRPGLSLHGATAVAARRSIVERFQADDGPPFLVLSLKAGGTGLTLTAASHVVHFDRWWNPAVENQATDRAFRIGQKQNVLVHKFVTRGTIEERVDTMLADKRKLTEDLLGGEAELNITELPDEQLLQLVRLDINRAQA